MMNSDFKFMRRLSPLNWIRIAISTTNSTSQNSARTLTGADLKWEDTFTLYKPAMSQSRKSLVYISTDSMLPFIVLF